MKLRKSIRNFTWFGDNRSFLLLTMKKNPFLIIAILFAFSLSAQEKAPKRTQLITEREPNAILKASIGIQSNHELFVGQEYSMEIVVSGEFDIAVNYTNMHVDLDESSARFTGPLRYSITPIDTGYCSITAGVLTPKGGSISLFMKTFKVVEYPTPPLNIGSISSGEVLQNVDKSSLFSCHYSPSSGIDELYPIESWRAELNGKIYEGNEETFTAELIDAINNCSERSFLHLSAKLLENSTGHLESEGVFIVK